jgi:hypothetical protein
MELKLMKNYRMKTLILIGALTLVGCCGQTLSTSSLAYRVGECTKVGLDYDIIYNDEGLATRVTCYKPGNDPFSPTNILQEFYRK